MTKASVAAKEHAIQTKGLSGTTDTFVAKQKVVQTELEATATSSKLASVGVKALSTAFNMFAGMAIMWGITKIIEGFEYLSESAERAKEKLSEIQTELNDNNSTYQSNRSTLVGLKEEYDALTKKAEALGGAQNLANDEYERYQAITSQILGITPKLTTGWNEEGEAISNKNNLLQASIDLLDEEYEKSLRNNTTKSKNEDVASGVIAKLDEFNNSVDTTTKSGTMADMRESFLNELEKLETELGMTEHDIVEKMWVYFDPDADPNDFWSDHVDTYEELRDLIAKDYDKLGNSFVDENNPIYELFSDEVIDDMIRNADAYFYEGQRILNDREALYQDYKDQLNWNAQATRDKSGNNAYQQLTDNGKAFINEYIEGLDYASIKTEEDFVEMANDIQKFTKLLASNEDVSKLVENIFTPATENETSTQYVERVQKAIADVQQYCKDNYIDLPINFTTLDDVDRMTEGVQAFLSDEFDNKVGELSLSDLQIASELEVDPSTLLSWEELLALIQKVKDETFNNEITVFSGFSEEQTKQIDDFESKLKTLSTTLSSLKDGSYQESGFADLVKDFPEIQGQSENLEQAITDLIYNSLQKLYDTLGTDLPDDVKNSLQAMVDSASGASVALDKAYSSIQKSHNALNDFKDAMNDNTLTDSVMNVVAGLSDNLNNLVAGFHAGTVSADELYSALLNHYNNDLENYSKALLEKNKLSTDFYNSLGLNDAEVVNTFAKNYGIDLQNCQNYAEAKKQIELSTLSLVAGNWQRYYNIQTNTLTAEYSKLESGAKNGDAYANKILAQINKYRSAMSQLDSFAFTGIETSFKGISSTFEANAEKIKNTSSGSSSEKDFDKQFNWVERVINKVSSALDKLKDKISNTYLSWTVRNHSLSKAMEKTNDVINMQQASYERYMQQANSVGLSQDYIEKIQNGTLNIETITDESLSNMIDEYQDWYDKAIECSDAIENLKNELAELAKQKFDNISTYFDSLVETTNKSINKLEMQRDNSYKVYNPNVYKGLYSETHQLIDYNTKKVQQLEDALDSAVNNGYIEVGSESWRKMYNEILDVNGAIEEYRIELNEIAQSEYEALLKPIEESLSRLESRKNVIDTMIDRLELQGYVASKGLYERQLIDGQERLETLKQKGQQLQQSLQDALSKGLEVGSDAWADMQSAIDDNTVSIMELENNMIELNNAIRDLEWSKFDRLQDTISRITEESDFMIGLFDENNLYDENGSITTEGGSIIGLHTQNYYTYLEQVKNYKDEIDKINDELVSDPTNTTLIDRKNELIDTYQNATKAAYDEYQAIVELGQNGYKYQIDSIKEIIDVKKKQLEADKALYEYQKNITEKTKNVADIQKQLASLANDDSEENKAKIQQLKVDLEDAQKELQDTQYDKWYNDQSEMLDSLYEEYESLMTEQSQNDYDIFTDMIEYANANAENIQKVINQKADDWNYTMSSISDTIWEPGFNGLTDIGSNIYEEIQQLCKINENMYRVSSDLGDLGVTQYGLETTVSDENTARGFIEQLYQGLLDRPADDSGMNYWISKLTNGETVQDIIKGFLESQEYVALNKSVDDTIYDLYKSVLGRTPESSGYQYWINQYQNGMSLSQIATQGFLDSDEFLSLDNWLRLLKKGSFSTGGVIGRTGEDGIVLAKVGEGILSKDNMKLLQKSIFDSNILAQNMVKLQNMDIHRTMNRETEQSIGDVKIINEISINHVDDYNDICNKFKSDPKFANMMQEMVLGGIVGKNGLSKNKYKW